MRKYKKKDLSQKIEEKGVRIAAKLATDSAKDQKEEAKIVMEAAKQLQNE